MTTIIPSYLLPSYQLLYIIFFFFSFAFYINCIFIRLYTKMLKTTVTTTISTMMMTTYSDDYDDYYPWLFAPPLSIIVGCFFFIFFSFYINCILIRLYTTTPRVTAPTVSTTTMMLSTVMTTQMTITLGYLPPSY